MTVYFKPLGGDFGKYFDFPHVVKLYNFNVDNLPQVRKWLEECCQGGVLINAGFVGANYRRENSYNFEYASDALLFKLKWGGVSV